MIWVECNLFQALSRPVILGKTKVAGIKLEHKRVVRLMEILLYSGEAKPCTKHFFSLTGHPAIRPFSVQGPTHSAKFLFLSPYPFLSHYLPCYTSAKMLEMFYKDRVG